jgi:hypothetical protein
MQVTLKFICDKHRHLVCEPYSVANLHAMAQTLGIKRCWFHGGRHPHYDIPKRRFVEVSARCEIMSARTIYGIINAERH